MPVANPDGYDFTFEPGQRLWRKNLRDNNGDGSITPGDGVDLNRNFPTKWGYDNEGSSPDPASETYRGTGAGLRARDPGRSTRFAERVGFEFLVNYHSAAELLLYGTGWQVATPTPGRRHLRGDGRRRRRTRRPRLRPRHLRRALHHQRRDRHRTSTEALRHARLHARDVDLRGRVRSRTRTTSGTPQDCGSGFEFPDDEALVQAEFEKNIPFALSVARSADDPDDPVSVGRAHGRGLPRRHLRRLVRRPADRRGLRQARPAGVRPCTTASTAAASRTAPAPEWSGGERYGDENDDYYAEFRGVVRGADGG